MPKIVAQNALDQRVLSYRDDIIKTLSKWVNVPSVKGAPAPSAPFGEPLREMLDLALEYSKSLGLPAKNVDGYAGHVEIGEGDTCVGVLVHLDVVPVGEGWTEDPFSGDIREGILYGRGASDNKGAAVISLYALKAIIDEKIPLKRRVRLIFGCDEESGWEDIAYYKTKEKMPDLGFSPDARYPVINAEKGILAIRLTAHGIENAGEYVIGIAEFKSGERGNVVPQKATCVISINGDSIPEDFREKFVTETVKRFAWRHNYDITVTKLPNGCFELISIGKAAHGASPEVGKNAAGQLLLALYELSIHVTAPKALHPAITHMAEHIGMAYDGAAAGVSCKDKESGALTLNLGILNITNGELDATLDIRYPVTEDEPALIKKLKDNFGEAGISAEKSGGKGPLFMPEDHFVVQRLLEVYNQKTGRPKKVLSMGGGTYARALKNAVAFGADFGDMNCHVHESGECVSLDDMMISAMIIAGAIVELAKDDIAL